MRGSIWIHGGTWRPMASHTDFPSIVSSTSVEKPSTTLRRINFLCPAVFGVFVYNTEDGCLSSSIIQGVFLHPGEALWNYFTSCESLFSVLVNPFFHKQLHPALVLVYKAAPRREALLCPRQSPGGIEQQGPLYMLLCHVKPLFYTVSDSLPWRWGCIWS